MTTETGRSRDARLRTGLIVSLAFHAIFVLGLLVWYLPRPTAAVTGPKPDPNIATRTAHDSPSSSSGDAGTVEPPASDNAAGDPPVDSPVLDSIPPAQIETAVTAAIENAEHASEQRQLESLSEQLGRIDRIGSPESIAEVGRLVRDSIGLNARATVPSDEAVSGAFDFGTAQFHEVFRDESEAGVHSYRGVLVDAQGRTMEVDLDTESGRAAYDAMERIKGSPLGEAIYRTLVMPMLDKLIEPRP
ncbi:MAG: hypothetical protein EA381_10775 [Planctomycetaceae bacterium]|nr:MAG: hypothetical protein EA381_10775 [Planctomycetaceae bacterium]